MVIPNANFTCIKDHLKVETNPVNEALSTQGVFMDEMDDFKNDARKSACTTERKPLGGYKGGNFSSVMYSILFIAISAVKYYGDVGRSIDTNIMEWSWIKRFNSLIKIKDNWSDQYSLS